jgi:hypothetical protein
MHIYTYTEIRTNIYIGLRGLFSPRTPWNITQTFYSVGTPLWRPLPYSKLYKYAVEETSLNKPLKKNSHYSICHIKKAVE